MNRFSASCLAPAVDHRRLGIVAHARPACPAARASGRRAPDVVRAGLPHEACAAYRAGIRSAALERFGWDARDLDVREAYAIFRLTSNPVRQMRRDWASRLESGLSLAAEVLGRAV